MMKLNETFLFVSLLVTLLMGVLSLLSYKKDSRKEFLHLSELWLSLAVNVVFVYSFGSLDTNFRGVAMLGWLWPLKTLITVLRDISGKDVVNKWHIMGLMGMGFVSFALGGYGYGFTLYSLPFALTVGCLGFYLTYDSYLKTDVKINSPFLLTTYIAIGLFFLKRLMFPFLGSYGLNGETGLFVEFLVLVGFASSLNTTYLEMFKKHHDQELEKTLKERSEKFVGQAKFSELGMMSAGIAHEINNPLAVIQARTTQLLRIYRDPNKQKDLADGLQQILYTSERINRTIQGVREFVHQDEKAPSTTISLKDLFDDVLAFCGQRMKNHGVNLRFYGIDDYSIMGHKIQLEQVILNLLNNSFDAIEFLPDKWIEVSCAKRGNKIQLYFKDSGRGIPQEIADKIMEPFFSTKNIGKGTGLGLALARGIVEKHGGNLLYVKGAPHTTFMLELPEAAHQEWGMQAFH